MCMWTIRGTSEICVMSHTLLEILSDVIIEIMKHLWLPDFLLQGIFSGTDFKKWSKIFFQEYNLQPYI